MFESTYKHFLTGQTFQNIVWKIKSILYKIRGVNLPHIAILYGSDLALMMLYTKAVDVSLHLASSRNGAWKVVRSWVVRS